VGKSQKFQLRGGLGNQMFIYAAGRWFGHFHGKKVRLEGRLLSLEKPHGGFIGDLKLSLPVSSATDCAVFEYLRPRLIDITTRSLRRITPQRFSRRMLEGEVEEYSNGYDSRLEQKKHPKIISGYFQTYRWASQVIGELRAEFQLASESQWLIEEKERAIKTNFLAIHVRRGDYEKSRDTFGVLSTEYYLAALEQVRILGKGWDEIWVFSDDIQTARTVLAPILGTNKVRFVQPPEEGEGGPFESLELFGFARYGIIANSTFSWWASFLSTSMEVVVAPNKWFRGLSDPKDLVPPHWRLAKSFWED